MSNAAWERIQIREVVEMHLAEILKLERKTQRALLEIYRESIAEIVEDLMVTPEVTFKAERLRQILAQMTAGIDAMERKLAGKLKADAREMQQLGLFQSKEMILEGEKLARVSAMSAQRLETVYAALIDAPALVAARDETEYSFKVWRADQERTIRQTVLRGVLESKHPGQVAEDLRKALGSKVEQYKIDRIATTETWRMVEEANRTGTDAAAEEFPDLGLEYQWVAVLDAATCDYCRELDGTRLRAGREGSFKYEISGGKRAGEVVYIKTPPVHPNCRCHLAIVSSRWERRKRERGF